MTGGGADGSGLPRLSVFFFSSADTGAHRDKYAFILDAAVLADRLGFEAAWLPERHFHAFGGLFPNPAVLAAALATRTSRIRLRAGSVVLPLHHPARVVEEWSMVDALSGGRVDLSLATGWNKGDFILGGCAFDQRREYLFEHLDTLRELWRGGEIGYELDGERIGVRTFPVPVQPELGLWLTATTGSDTFRRAGELGLNVLTGYLRQRREEMERSIEVYRDAHARGGHSAAPHVTLMVHSHAAEDAAQAVAAVVPPLAEYVDGFLGLNERGRSAIGRSDAALTEQERRDLAEYSARKYAWEMGLIGDEARVLEQLHYFAGIGVDEVACLVDYGLAANQDLASLRRLGEIRARAADREPSADPA